MTDEHVLIDLVVPRDQAEFASDILWASGAQAVQERDEDTLVHLVTDLGERPLDRWHDIIEAHPVASTWTVATLTVPTAVADTWRDHAHTTLVADVRIVPAWQQHDRGQRDLLIDPGGAFGMGDHPTTRATLELALAAKGSTALDIGCGSGVLAIALAKFRGMRCVAVDIAPAAVEAAHHNANLNDVTEFIEIEMGDVRLVRGTYDVVLANILAPVLLSDAADIAARVTSRGSLILSGFNRVRLADIQAAYELLGLRRTGLVELDGWLALQMQRGEEG